MLFNGKGRRRRTPPDTFSYLSNWASGCIYLSRFLRNAGRGPRHLDCSMLGGLFAPRLVDKKFSRRHNSAAVRVDVVSFVLRYCESSCATVVSSTTIAAESQSIGLFLLSVCWSLSILILSIPHLGYDDIHLLLFSSASEFSLKRTRFHLPSLAGCFTCSI